ncbi:MAG: hypothetical protein WDW36_000966 [Sanguina aurantia]
MSARRGLLAACRGIAAIAKPSSMHTIAPLSQLMSISQQQFSMPSLRSLWTSSPSLSLASTLGEEISHEVEDYKKPQELSSGPPAPWVLADDPGDTLITLKRKYKGEEVEVNLQVNNQPGGDFQEGGESEEEDLSLVAFNVQVVKGDKSLVFEVESDGTEVTIMHVSYEPTEGHTSESAYTGPVFEELDEQLQKDFKAYLEERGISAEMGEFLRHLIYDKEQREYVDWMHNVKKFVN